MMLEDANNEGEIWPTPKFRFEVDFGSQLTGIAFQEILGMDDENQIIEYRKGNSEVFSHLQLPGLEKYGNITMKRGLFYNDQTFWDWHAQMFENTGMNRQTIFIKLLDENGSIIMLWQLNNAWPTKITSSDFNQDENEVAIETLEITYEHLIIKK